MPYQLVDTASKDLVEQTLHRFFEKSIEDAGQMDDSYLHLWQNLHGLIQSGGKRLRPQMTIVAYQAFGGKAVEKIIPVAAAQELLHFALLIHDDIIDRDHIRYGVENVAGKYMTTYSQYGLSEEDKKHYALSAAILGGDLMLSSAHQMISSSSLREEEKSIAHSLLTKGIFDVAGGELLDTELSFAPYSAGDAIKVAQYKTATYSFVVPLLTGAKLAGIDSKRSTILETYAKSLGIAFQLVDDILGIFGNQLETGKSNSSDITEGKMTYMIEQALTTMSDNERKIFDQAFGNLDASDEQINAVRNILNTSGAKQKTQDLANEYANKARTALDEMDLDAPYRETFERFVSIITERTH